MKVVAALFKHETNTFSPVASPLARFGPEGRPYYGEGAREALRGTNTALGAYIDLCQRNGLQLETPIAADSRPSGPIPDDVYEHIAGHICDAVARGCDAVMLDLHGAAVTQSYPDAEGELLRRIRAIRPDIPIAVSLDLHANLTSEIVANCSVLCGYRTYPHVDIRETGMRAGNLLLRALRGEIRPVVAWGQLPVLMHTLCMETANDPFRSFVAAAEQASAPGVLDASVFGGFTMADVSRPCFSAVCVADDDGNSARTVVDGLLQLAWDRRAQCVYRPEPLVDSVARAKLHTEGPVLLIDHSDNCSSGGTQDTMAVIAEARRQGLTDMAVFAVCDPEAVDQMSRAGVGNSITLQLGGKLDMPKIGLRGEPLRLTGRVKALTDGSFIVRGPMMTGMKAAMGRTGVLETDTMEIVVCERHHEPWDLGCLRSVGIEPTAKRYILLKSRMHYRAGFLSLAKAIIECDGVGVTSSNYDVFKYRSLLRPVYPIDEHVDWHPEPLPVGDAAQA